MRSYANNKLGNPHSGERGGWHGLAHLKRREEVECLGPSIQSVSAENRDFNIFLFLLYNLLIKLIMIPGGLFKTQRGNRSRGMQMSVLYAKLLAVG